MRKEVIASLLIASLATGLQAGGDIGGVVSIENEVAPVEVKAPVKVEVEAPKKIVKEVKKVEEKKSNSNFYIVAKGLSILGDDADTGYGGGLNVGYKITDALAVEVGGDYAQNDLDSGEEATYTTLGASLVYTVQATDNLGVFGKVGYVTENTEVDDLNIDNDESGVSYGAGVEYKMTNNASVTAEYEGADIDSTRGDAVSLGLKYNF